MPGTVSLSSTDRQWFSCAYCGEVVYFAGVCPNCRDLPALDPLGPTMHQPVSEEELLGAADLHAGADRGKMPG